MDISPYVWERGHLSKNMWMQIIDSGWLWMWQVLPFLKIPLTIFSFFKISFSFLFNSTVEVLRSYRLVYQILLTNTWSKWRFLSDLHSQQMANARERRNRVKGYIEVFLVQSNFNRTLMFWMLYRLMLHIFQTFLFLQLIIINC